MLKNAPSNMDFRKSLPELHEAYQNAKAQYKTRPKPRDAVRRLQELVCEICATYVIANKIGQKVDFPPALANELSFAFGNLATGHQSDLLRPQRERGRPKASFSVELAEETAVRYVLAARKGWLEDRHPVQTVVSTFEINDATWRRWRKKHGDISTNDITNVRGIRSIRRWVEDYLLAHPAADVYCAFDALRVGKGRRIKENMEFAARHYITLPGAYSWKAIEKRGAR